MELILVMVILHDPLQRLILGDVPFIHILLPSVPRLGADVAGSCRQGPLQQPSRLYTRHATLP